MGKFPERTVLVSLGTYRKFSDVDGRHILHLSDKAESRLAFADRLKKAGCAVVTENRSAWLTAGSFDAASETAEISSGKGASPITTFKKEYKFDGNAQFKRKLWIEFRNVSDQCLSLRNPFWKTINGGIHATIRSGTFQLQLGNTWCPEKIGAQQINLPPGDLCRLWALPDEDVTDEQLKKLSKFDASLGLVVISINGIDVPIPV